MDKETQFLEAIRTHGLRMTRQRKLVLDVLGESQEHLDAESLHDRVKSRDPHIGLATVYRTLSLLKEMGLVSQQHLGEEHSHFETAPEEPHYHFTCLNCKRVIEFEMPSLTEFIHLFALQERVKVSDVHLSLTGYCTECQGIAEKGVYDHKT